MVSYPLDEEDWGTKPQGQSRVYMSGTLVMSRDHRVVTWYVRAENNHGSKSKDRHSRGSQGPKVSASGQQVRLRGYRVGRERAPNKDFQKIGRAHV